MVVAHVRIAPLSSTAAVGATVIRELVYAAAGSVDRVEHVRIHTGPHGADIVAFIDTQDPVAANDTLCRLVARMLADSPLLRMWRIV